MESGILAEVSRRCVEHGKAFDWLLLKAVVGSHTFSDFSGFISLVLFILISFLGGPSAAKFAGNQLVNLLSVLNNSNEPTVLKMVRRPYFWATLHINITRQTKFSKGLQLCQRSTKVERNSPCHGVFFFVHRRLLLFCLQMLY